ncbi:hypothetical protein KCP69_10040 [Salmonella enterica subsp. enterica]|nr:hypothetical protein KCP69_10040 [Salmonella enterica subsp. enterica]
MNKTAGRSFSSRTSTISNVNGGCAMEIITALTLQRCLWRYTANSVSTVMTKSWLRLQRHCVTCHQHSLRRRAVLKAAHGWFCSQHLLITGFTIMYASAGKYRNPQLVTKLSPSIYSPFY